MRLSIRVAFIQQRSCRFEALAFSGFQFVDCRFKATIDVDWCVDRATPSELAVDKLNTLTLGFCPLMIDS
jgi:hypothetical protein